MVNIAAADLIVDGLQRTKINNQADRQDQLKSEWAIQRADPGRGQAAL
ncbi:hypothetical protein LOT_1686 [Lentilactobacillus otakiensis DSM 19908 = JCM 15040]|uniref:Uncharacterized protein n=1 Tax=Lentilactobacillus otakiensis DSM 19908 = JCM 15040 TaxID=1423780 RepID=S4NT72_9LACO|nr:hypothetical protein LOT_1686 [Lentilactobacillus otakiensis DSM 19908 = JCM 15040]